ncbi:MAG TPA: ribokinase [Gemmataceae bacterium]|jgi:ribokinase|nr:ribokinase [Gemmataceae bacterium]
MNRITVVGSANMDLTFRAATLPRPGETVFGTSFYRGFGGKGANQAVAAARLGADVSFVGKVGTDEFGQAIREQLTREGIDVTHLGDDPDRPTGTAAILVDDAGENAIVGVPGANLGLTPDDMQTAAALLQSSGIVLAPCETMIETITAAFQIAHRAGATCILNPAPARELSAELLACVDMIVPNELELRALTGHSTETLGDVTTAANRLRTRGPRVVIVTLGPRGVLIVDAHGQTHINGLIVTAVDTSGAGDAFCGALATYLVESLSIVEAAAAANRVAALSVTRPGTQASFPRGNELNTKTTR